MEVGQEVKIIMVRQRWDKCREAYRETDGNILCAFPPKCPHVCSNCGFKEIYRKKYPYQMMIPVSEEKELTTFQWKQNFVEKKWST